MRREIDVFCVYFHLEFIRVVKLMPVPDFSVGSLFLSQAESNTPSSDECLLHTDLDEALDTSEISWLQELGTCPCTDDGPCVSHIDLVTVTTGSGFWETYSVKAVGTRRRARVEQTYWGHNRDELIKAQSSDPALKTVLEWHKNKVEPSRESLFSASPQEKYKNVLFTISDTKMVQWRNAVL